MGSSVRMGPAFQPASTAMGCTTALMALMSSTAVSTQRELGFDGPGPNLWVSQVQMSA